MWNLSSRLANGIARLTVLVFGLVVSPVCFAGESSEESENPKDAKQAKPVKKSKFKCLKYGTWKRQNPRIPKEDAEKQEKKK